MITLYTWPTPNGHKNPLKMHQWKKKKKKKKTKKKKKKKKSDQPHPLPRRASESSANTISK